MIISASYKTDIPAFYGDWFVRRLKAGHVGMVNAYSRQPYRISLEPDDVSGIVFWTKNVRPFLKHVSEITSFGRPAYVQFTINGYPSELESAVVDWRKSVEAARVMQENLGARAIVWRYDPVILSALTPWSWHIENFERIADAMVGVTDEVVVSFLQVYRKTKSNMDAAAVSCGNKWWTPDVDEQRGMAAQLSALAELRGIELTICSQPDLITTQKSSRCIDSTRLSDLSGRPVAARMKGNRPGCECDESRDIGEYDTCPHGCIYCYAVRSHALAIERFRKHDPDSAFLFPRTDDEHDPKIVASKRDLQHRLDV